MKKVYTFFSRPFLLLVVFALLAGFTSRAQICGGIVEDFDGTMGSTQGFTGDFSYGSSDPTDGHLVKTGVVASGIYTITTPTYKLIASDSYIGYGFLLDGSERTARIEVAVVYMSTLSNEMTSVFLGQFVPAYNPGSSTSDVCRAVSLSDLPGFPAGGLYRFRIELTPVTGNGTAASNITFDDFRTNGTLSQQPLPVSFIGLEAKKLSAGVQLVWKVAGEENVVRYEVERSADGRSFTTVGTVSRHGKDTYTFSDATAAGAAVYYRIRNVDGDGKYKYSSIARLAAGGSSEILVRAFPQPVRGTMTVQHPGALRGSLLTLSTADGRVVRTLVPAQGTLQTSVDMAALQPGLYLVRFSTPGGASQTLKVMKQ